MLIVNADDLGRSEAATDSAIACHARGRITSASAMVFMKDSVRAAQLAMEAGIGVGLHLNLSEELSSTSVPDGVRRSHDQVRRFLKASKYALLVFNPRLNRQFEDVFAAQLEEFHNLFGRAPSHVDGHQHMHLATNMLLQRVLPEGMRVRRSFSFQAGEKSLANRWYRLLVDRALAGRHRTTDYFFSLSHHLERERLERLVSLAGGSVVELMVHPELQAEHDFLMSEAYREAISRVRLASYDEI